MIEIRPIPDDQMPTLSNKVSLACMAKRTVYFEVQDQPIDGSPQSDEPVTAFDSEGAGAEDTPPAKIVAVPTIPTKLPLEYTVSPATLTRP